MKTSFKTQDRFLTLFLILIALGIPFLISAYDQRVWQEKTPDVTKVFTLTGHIDRGWVAGEIRAFEAATSLGKEPPVEHPVITVSKGNKVVIKLTSSDVIHGFSLKDFGVYVEDGIIPGKVSLVSFVADKEGRFQFTCNAICGRNHEKMIGTLVVEA